MRWTALLVVRWLDDVAVVWAAARGNALAMAEVAAANCLSPWRRTWDVRAVGRAEARRSAPQQHRRLAVCTAGSACAGLLANQAN